MSWVERWLAGVKSRDGLERRQASMLQVILLVALVALIAAGISSLARSEPNAVPNFLGAAFVAGLLAVLRRGLFGLAVTSFVAFLIAAFGLALARVGPESGGPYLALLMVPLVVAGLLLPRALLALTAVAVFGTGQLAVGVPLLLLGNFFFATLFVTVAVDQFGGVVRSALRVAVAHEAELEAGRAALATRTTELGTAVAELEEQIAERERLEAEHERVQERMLQSQRLESIGRLAGGVAHDFNNLLTAIRGYADLVADSLPPDDERQSDLDAVRHASDQAASLTRQLLAFSRSQELRPAVVDLNEIVAGVEPLLRRLLGEQITLVVQRAPDLWPVLIDPSQMESIVVNLAVNARDAMESGGRLTIETANVELDNDYARTHADVVPGPYTVVAVSDTGVGMDSEVLAHIFEPFFTTKALGKGTGLGLSTVYGTVRQSGGHIWVYSEPAHGTQFKIYLPRTEAIAAAPAPVAPASPRAGRETILVAEDEDAVRDMVVTALERHGYTVIAVRTGEEALEAIDRHPTEIGVLLTDVVMPGISGLELIERARQRRPDLRAICTSGYTPLKLNHRPIPHDVSFLEKPFTLGRLNEVIREVLAN